MCLPPLGRAVLVLRPDRRPRRRCRGELVEQFQVGVGDVAHQVPPCSDGWSIRLLETALLSRGFSPAPLGVHLCWPRPREKKKPRCIAATGCVVLLGEQDRAGLLSALADEFDHPLALANVGQLGHQRREILVWSDLGGSLRSHAS